jgi:cytosine/adenosine deaminase-related metal-dependent hydrolase
MEQGVCFSCSQIVAGDDLTLLADVDMVVVDGRITLIGKAERIARRVDLGGKLVIPMFIDAHSHLGDTGAKELGIGLPLDQVVIPPHGLKHLFLGSLDRETHIAMMRDGLEEMLQNGIIACGDFREQGLEGLRRLRKAAEGLPIHVKALGRIEENCTLQELEAAGRKMLEEADGLGVRDAGCYDPDVLKKLRDEFPEKIFAVHAAEDRKAEQQFRRESGISQTASALEWGADLLVHLVHASREDFELAARSGAIAVTCPRSNGILGDGIPHLADWNRAGLPFAIGTDNVMLASPDMLREMDFASRVTRGLEEDPASIDHRALLKSATIIGARALRLDDRLGSLTPGKDASFVVFDLTSPNLCHVQDPFSAVVHRACRADIEAIYIRGEHYFP